MDIYSEIEKLMEYSIKNGLVNEEDKILIRNLVSEALDLDTFREFSEEETEKIRKEVVNAVYPCEILDNIVKWAGENGKLKSDTVTFQDLMNSKIMGQIVPRTSEIRKEFWDKYDNYGIDKATEYFYELSKKSNYIRMDRISKNIHWTYENEYGNLEITINLSKPEKDPRDIAMAKNKISTNYPKGLLDKENEGYMGRSDHPGRQNHRTIRLDLLNEHWYLQYSPYIYYNEHSIVFSHEHKPMKIDKSTFERLLEFVKIFPHYFIGSNADLPIVGGSILSHDHFQAGRHIFPMEKAKIKEKISFVGYEDINAGIVNWPMSVIRLSGEKNRLVELADKILKKWIEYNAEKLDIYAYTKGERHNTITPIARFKDGKYELDLVLRNNLTNKNHPLGIFHPHDKHHNIKKENIGLIEVMGLAILPGRLMEETAQIKEIILKVRNSEKFKNDRSYEPCYKEMNNNELLRKHTEWLKYYLEEDKIKYMVEEDAEIFIRNAIGETFSKVLENCGVFKNNEDGEKGFRKFIKKVNEKEI
ncbi:MAG: UDP-glucose--hexose-1-phosphate uridylyltransferase [Leptotrichiaceae bacterium]|nr:UDP-glucose--hexose-1-phosphate uridylyltransferase [Leptotrichiaceae bacterium]